MYDEGLFTSLSHYPKIVENYGFHVTRSVGSEDESGTFIAGTSAQKCSGERLYLFVGSLGRHGDSLIFLKVADCTMAVRSELSTHLFLLYMFLGHADCLDIAEDSPLASVCNGLCEQEETLNRLALALNVWGQSVRLREYD